MGNKEKLTIIFEGPDGSGKSTLIEELRKRYPELDLVDRAFISDDIYAVKFDRDSYEGVPVDLYLKYWAEWHKNNRDIKIILCNPSLDELVDRCYNKNDDIRQKYEPDSYLKVRIKMSQELKQDKNAFEHTTKYYVNKYGFDLLEVDTGRNVKNCIRDIEEFIND